MLRELLDQPTQGDMLIHDLTFQLATIGYQISLWGLRYHRNLDDWVKNILQAPMSSPGGLIEILKGGKFFERQTISVEQLLDGYRDVLEARVVVAVLRAKVCAALIS